MYSAGESRNIKASFNLSNNGELHSIKATFIMGIIMGIERHQSTIHSLVITQNVAWVLQV